MAYPVRYSHLVIKLMDDDKHFFFVRTRRIRLINFIYE